MNKTLSRAIAVTAVSAAGLAGTLTATPAAIAAPGSGSTPSSVSKPLTPHGKPVNTGFGYRADVFGTKVVVEGVEVRGVKDGYAHQRCTTQAGRVQEMTSRLALPEELAPLVKLSATQQRSETYKQGSRTGVRGISTIADISIGGVELPGLGKLPSLKIEGLQSVADAFHDGKKYGHQESFGFKGISLDYDGTVVDGTPLAALLDILNQVTAPISQVVNQVINLLRSLVPGQKIEIPGLGSLSLGRTSGTANSRVGISESYALKVEITATGNPTVLQLGRARTRISEAGRAGVFRGTATGAEILSDLPLLNLGNLGARALPCEGTKGKVVTDRAGNYSILGGLINVTGVTYKFMGDHLAGGAAKAMMGTDLGTVTIPSLNLEIKGLTSRVNVRKPAPSKRNPNPQAVRKVMTDYATVLHNGKPVTLKPGTAYELDDSNFLNFRKLFQKNYHGIGVHGLSLRLANIGLLDLGTSAARIFPR